MDCGRPWLSTNNPEEALTDEQPMTYPDKKQRYRHDEDQWESIFAPPLYRLDEG